MIPAGGRQYKSRKARPCDFCRDRKTACHMEDGPPCRLCAERQRACTFVKAPGMRRRPNRTNAEPNAENQSRSRSQLQADEAAMQPCDLAMDQERTTNMQFQTLAFDPQMFGQFEPEMDFTSMDGVPNTLMHRSINYLDENLDMLLSGNMAMTQNSVQQMPELPTPTMANNTDVVPQTSPLDPTIASSQQPKNALESFSNVSYRTVGSTGDLDLYVLSHRSYNELDESNVQYRGLKYRRMSSTATAPGLPPPVFIVTNSELAAQTQPRLHPEHIEEAKEKLTKLISPKLAFRLVLLFLNYVHPHYPVLSLQQLPEGPDDINRLPPSLLAAICALAIPFVIYDDVLSIWLPESPSEDELFRLAWTLTMDELHTPHLTTIQTCLLLLQSHSRKYLPLTPFKPALLHTTVALCHCLGLNRSSMHWHTMPVWERRLRKRIWWAVYVMDKWISLGESIPSILRDEEADVESLMLEDFDDDLAESSELVQPVTHFPHLVTLTQILDDICKDFFSVRATSRTAIDLGLSLEVAKPLRARLKQWHDNLPHDFKWRRSARPTNEVQAHRQRSETLWHLDAISCFHLAYHAAQLTLFRALLRPVSMMATIAQSYPSPAQVDPTELEEINGPKAIIKGALTAVEDVVDLVEQTDSSDWDAFWHSWSRTNFAVASSVMLLLLMTLRPPLRRQQEVRSPNGSAGQSRHAPSVAETLSENANAFLNLQSDYRTLLDSMTRWRWALKVASRGPGGRKGLMNLSLLRMDALLAELCATPDEGGDDRLII